jgi:hypothetical protein
MTGANTEAGESLDDWERPASPKQKIQWVGKTVRRVRARPGILEHQEIPVSKGVE